MDRTVNRTLIGGFVVVALALAVVAVIVFGGGRFFADTTRYIMYFDESVAGLSVGSPVILNGVTVGKVLTIDVEFYTRELVFRTPVEIEIFENISIAEGSDLLDEIYAELGRNKTKVYHEMVRRLVDRGLRAQLMVQSMVTGQLSIEIAIRPDTPVHLQDRDGDLPELPTLPSDMARLRQTLRELPVQPIAEDLQRILARVNEILAKPEVDSLTVSAATVMANLADLSGHWSARSEALGDHIEAALQDVHRFAAQLDGHVLPLIERLEEDAHLAKTALQRMSALMDSAQASLGDDSAMVYEIRASLQAFIRAVDTLQSLAEYLDQHPEALLRGK